LEQQTIDIPTLSFAHIRWYGPSGPDESLSLFVPNVGTTTLALDEFFTVKQSFGPNVLYRVSDWKGKLFLERLEPVSKA
jgi:hypothetical protein